MTRRRKLFRQIVLPLTIMQLLAALVLGGYAWHQVGRIYTEEANERLDAVSPILARVLIDAFDDPSNLDHRIRVLSTETGCRLTIIAPDGTVISDSSARSAEMDNHANRPEIREALASGTGRSSRFSRTMRQQMQYVATRVVGPDGTVLGTARAALAVESAHHARIEAFRTASIVALLLFLATVLVTWQVSRRVTSSVGRLARSAAMFASGDFAHRIPDEGTHELAVLTDALQHMAAQLDEKVNELQSRRNEQLAILQSMSNGVIALDNEQRFVDVNTAAERLLAITAPLARGRLLHELVREPDLHEFVAEAFREGGPTSAEFTLQQHGSMIVRAVSEPLIAAGDEQVGVLVLLNDVTRLRRLESLRSDFAANVSHELRTPITSIKGYVETLRELGPEDHGQAERFLDVIHRNTTRLEAIIEDLLALARLERTETRAGLEMMPMSIDDCASNVILQFADKAAAKSITIRNDTDPSLHVHGSRQLLEQALGNLVANAVNYSEPETPVTIRATRGDAGDVFVDVIDEGPGIAEEHLPRLFERFYRADSARSRALGGTGLGLAIVKHIALVHGGRIEVMSTVGEGSTFRLVLPVDGPESIDE